MKFLPLLPLFWMAIFLFSSCSTPEVLTYARVNPQPETTPWPEAEALFHQDPRWLGADGAYSVDLGNGRVLWLFADTFIATSPAHVRRESTMIRNSVAIEQGYDPSRAAMKFYWRNNIENPTSFFPEQGDDWYWPGDGIRVGPVLLVFLMKMQAMTPGPFGFAATGWEAVLITNPDDEPGYWKIKILDCPQNNFGVVIGSGGVLREGDYIYAFGSREPAVHDIYLVRWPVEAILLGNLQSPQWWDGTKSAWLAQRDLPPKPQPIFANGVTEFTVDYDPQLKAFLEIQTQGFGDAQIALRTAPVLTGPWSPLQIFYRPPEADLPGVFNYAAKAHPELTGTGADLILTYATNAADFSKLVGDTQLYYPRVLKAQIAGSNGKQ
jgi:hypothetical protein